VVRDQETKDRLAELYRAAAGDWMIERADRLAGTGHEQERVMRSAAHLARHLGEVPLIVVPTIIGVHDGSGRPGLFDSVLQSVWSFCVALRARGLGTAWTTAILARQAELAELLAIPDGMTPVALLPVAWTKGSEFRRAPRYPARRITYLDRFGTTWEQGPADPPRLSDGPGAVVEVDIKAPADVVWPLVTDINVGARVGEEFTGARWTDGFERAALGARFIGANQHPAVGPWETTCTVDRFVEGREFGWLTSDPERPGARWWFELAPIVGATRLRYSTVLGPGWSATSAAIENMPDKEARILRRRLTEVRGNMALVVEAIRQRAETSAGT
jgi:nitroreductase